MAIYQGTTKVASNIISGDTLPIGSMIPYGSLTIPEGWLRCDGSAVSRTTYSQLFSVIGTSYGVGDGSTTFNLPNKKGKVSVGYDSAQTEFNAVGKTGGAKTHTLTVEQMPSHNHIPQGRNVGGGTESVIPQAGSGDFRETASVGTTYTGGGGAHNNIQPYETDVWIIKALQTPGVVATVVDNLTSTSSINALSAKQGKVLNDKTRFSETEQLIGKWFDDNLYRKVIYVSSIDCTAAGFKYVNHGIGNIKFVKSISYSFGSTAVGSGIIQTYNNVISAIACTPAQIRFYNNAWEMVPTWYFVIEYTKTS